MRRVDFPRVQFCDMDIFHNKKSIIYLIADKVWLISLKNDASPST
jgi:hypothetical protein